MKILIVDDEELTRTGLIASVDWDKLGINEIYQADDGLNGLKIASEVKPDIILSDVRMPRMDGITMLERIEKLSPDTVVVFMSGYSDKEYLKAAIQLKAIDYIEKPIEAKELNATLKKAVDRCGVIKFHSIADESHENTKASELAHRFTLPYRSNADAVDALCKELSKRYGHTDFKYITTIIVKVSSIPEEPQILNNLYDALEGYLSSMNLRVIFTQKKSSNVIFHIYGDIKPTDSTLQKITDQIILLMTEFNEYYIAVGETVQGKENAYKSYESAVILLQGSFFMSAGSVIYKKYEKSNIGLSLNKVRELSGEYMKAVDGTDKAAVDAIMAKLGTIDVSSDILENQLKAIYHDMLLHLFKTRRRLSMATDLSIENQETIMDVIDKCFCFEQLQKELIDKTHSFFEDNKEDAVDNPTIRLICEYIANHYSDTEMSVKSISDHAALSTSYACTYFKNETGMTLNQYITDFRMKKAKQLLTDPRNRVNDVSAAVGYSDGNYFTKSFRKYTGLTPSEFREQVIRT